MPLVKPPVNENRDSVKPSGLDAQSEVKRPWYSVRREFVIALIVAVAFYVVVWALVG